MPRLVTVSFWLVGLNDWELKANHRKEEKQKKLLRDCYCRQFVLFFRIVFTEVAVVLFKQLFESTPPLFAFS